MEGRASVTVEQAFAIAQQEHRAGRLGQAEAIYRQILAHQPNHADSLHYLGMIAHQTGHLDGAVQLMNQSLAADPVNPAAYSNLGNVLFDQRRFEDAIAAYRKAIELKPDYAEAYGNLGNPLAARGSTEQAITAYRQAIALRPNYPEAFSNLGNCLTRLGQVDEAIAAHRQAILLKPDYAEAYTNLGIACKEMGQIEDAVAAFAQAVALRPQSAVIHDNLVYHIYFHPDFSEQAIQQEQRRWNQFHAETLAKAIQLHNNDRNGTRQLRIAYLSPDFREHVVGRNLLPLFTHHDRERFHITCYSQVARPDAMASWFESRADQWRNIVRLSDAQAADLIRQDQIDILVDLTLHISGNRLLVFARKPAPVQVTFAGYPGSTGLAAIDYRLTDPYLDPPGRDESIYSEQTVRLPHSFWCYQPEGEPIPAEMIPVSGLPAHANGYITFGCLNSFSKINDQVLRLWSKVLGAVPSSHLLLLAPEGSHRRRTAELLERENIDPGRIDFVPRQSQSDYLKLYHRVDIGLDSFPYNGHTTSLDSFWMGVPVVTLTGRTIVGRAGLCQLMNLKLPELIANSPDQFVNIATELAKDLPRLGQLRTTLRQRMRKSPLMDSIGFTRDIEAAYRQMWQRWCDR